MEQGVLIALGFIVLMMVLFTVRAVQIVPQARARNVERLGRYRKTLEPGMNFIIPIVDRVKPLIDLREQVVSFLGAPVITEDNLVVLIDTVLFFQVTDPRAADYEIVNYIQAIEQLTATMLRSVIGSMDLEQSLTSRDRINTMLRGVLDDASGKWGIRVTRVEIKKIDPPVSVKEAMEKQMRAEREKRAAILTAEGVRQSQILTADGDKQGTVLRAEGDKQSAILRAEGQAQAIGVVFQSIHNNNPDPKLLAYQYIQTLPQIAQGTGNSVWVIPSEVTGALRMLGSAFGGDGGGGPEPATGSNAGPTAAQAAPHQAQLPAQAPPSLPAQAPPSDLAELARPAQVPAPQVPAPALPSDPVRLASHPAELPALAVPPDVHDLASRPAEVPPLAVPTVLHDLASRPTEVPVLAVPVDLQQLAERPTEVPGPPFSAEQQP